MKAVSSLNDYNLDVTNVYRTDNYIVYQSIHVCYGGGGNLLMSEDVFQRRTPELDRIYEKTFGDETDMKRRKRMRVAASTRIYID